MRWTSSSSVGNQSPSFLSGITSSRRLMTSRYVYILPLLLSLLGAQALAQWRTNQRSHALSILPVNSTLRLCQFTNGTRLRSFLKPLLTPRIVGTREHASAGDFIKDTLEGLGFYVEQDTFSAQTPYGARNFRNLIATYDTKAPRRLVLACHYDSKILRGQVFIGATDSAVPCAMLLDIAATLKPYMYRRVHQNIALQLIFFDGEEAFNEWTATDSIYGSRHLAAKWERAWYPTTDGSAFELSRELDRMDVLMLLDLLGTPNPQINNAIGNGANNLFAELPKIEQQLRSYGCLFGGPQRNQVFNGALSNTQVEDDHVPFLQRGVPILHLISVPFPSVWHTVHDNERALDYPTINSLTVIVRVFVAKYLGIAPL